MSGSARWKKLGLHEPISVNDSGSLGVTDLLMWALRIPDVTLDPIDGILKGAANDLSLLSWTLQERGEGDVSASLRMIARRIEVAAMFLEKCDRSMPPEPHLDDGPELADSPSKQRGK